MNLTYLKRTDSPQLLLLYAGWSADPSAFEGIECPGYDIAVAWDFSELTPLEINGYAEVVLIAWSLGVHAAELTALHLPLTLTVAVNGTPSPVSDSEGIPVAVFHATAGQLTEQNLTRFRRRMGAPSLPRGPQSIDSLKAQLLSFPEEKCDFRWDRAVISSGDLIFPPANQRQAWSGRSEIHEIEGKHFPDFQRIINTFVIDKTLVGSRFKEHRLTYDSEASVQHRIADHLFQLWQKHGLSASSVLEIGAGSGYFTSLYEKRLGNSELTLWDLVPSSANVVQADAEKELPATPTLFNAIVSASTMQWFNSPAAFLLAVERKLTPGGLAVISTFGPRTYEELTQAGVIPLPYYGEESLRRIVPSGLEILELHGGLIKKMFPSVIDVFHHIRATGVNARPTLRPMREILASYPLAPDGRASLTYQPIYLVLRKI